ncbi:hypothetical protein Tco_0612942 [Tanacetum coccineum]
MLKLFGVQNMTTAGTRAVVNTGKGKMDTDLKSQGGFGGLREITWIMCPKTVDHSCSRSLSMLTQKGFPSLLWLGSIKDTNLLLFVQGNPEILLQDHAVVDSGCSSHMTGNKAYLSDYEDYNGGFVAFGSDPKGDELKFNLFSVSQMCDKKNNVLFTETECLILSPSFKLLDESQVVLRAPRKDDVYSLDLKNIVPSGEAYLQKFWEWDTIELSARRVSNMAPFWCGYHGGQSSVIDLQIRDTEDDSET